MNEEIGLNSKQRETRLVTEYCIETYPDAQQVFYRKRLGPIPQEAIEAFGSEKGRRLGAVWNPWADAIVITDKIILIEGKIRATSAALGQILHYRKVLPDTPDLNPYLDLPLECVLVAPWLDAYMIDLLEEHDIRYAHYEPAWIAEYMEDRKHYWSKEYQQNKQLGAGENGAD